jgi:hypothetical protein
MTLRAYLTLLRPVRTLLLSAFYGWAIGFTQIKTFGGLAVPESLFLVCTIIGPATLGAFLIGPLHEVMHRSFAVMIPDLRIAFRRWHLITCGIAAISCFIGAELLGYPFPRTASAGLILASMSAPLLNRRRSLGWGSLLGMVAYIALVALVALPSRELILGAGRAFPWALLVAGSAFAAFCFWRGFSAEDLRERSRSALLFCCFQSSFPLVGSGGFAVARHMQTENGRLLAARKANKSGRDWSVASVGSSLREWAAVVRHCRFGGSDLRQHLLGQLILGVSPLAMVALIGFFVSRADVNNPIPSSEFFALLVGAFHPRTADLISTLLYVFALLFGLLGAASFAAPIVLAPYRLPISRRRLALSTLLETHRLTSLVAAIFATELCLLAIGSTILAGQPFDLSILARPLAATLCLLPAALLVQAFLVRAARHPWLLIAGLAIPPLVGGAAANAITVRLGARAARFAPGLVLDRVFTPAGIALVLAAIALAAALHWLALRRHFRTCDFSRPLMLVAPGGAS